MVVLSVAVSTKQGKALVSRQFVDMSRLRIEGLLTAFPKLVGDSNKQHTFVETEAVRYLYQPLDQLYILIITNRASNIIEDLDTLRLISKVVPDIIGASSNISEERVADKCFDLIFAFDEVITHGGYRDPITLQQIKTNLEMESHEEKLHNMIKMTKMESAREQARDAATAIRNKKRDVGSGMQGIGGGAQFEAKKVNDTPTPVSSYSEPAREQSVSTQKKAVQGMSLTAASKSKTLEDALVKEDKLAPIISKKTASSQESSTDNQNSVNANFPISIILQEKVTANLTREGAIEVFEVKGSLNLTAVNEEVSNNSVQLQLGRKALEQFQFVTNPKINKQLFDESAALAVKDVTKGFPVNRPTGILRWSLTKGNESYLPIKINCWAEEEGRGLMNVTIDYSLEYSETVLHDVKISIPCGTRESPKILNIDGNYKFNATENCLVWNLDLIDRSNATGNLEFSIAQKNPDAFFPIAVDFQSNHLFCPIEVTGVTNASDGRPIVYSMLKSVSTEEYKIE